MLQGAEKHYVIGSDMQLDEHFWNTKYINNDTGWDLGGISPPLQTYIDQLNNKHISILIPGCGNSYEADYLLQRGFTNITLIDIAPILVERLKQRYAGQSSIRVIQGNFFDHEGTYDLILEQTFFCALRPEQREQYVTKMKTLLKPGGRLVGVLFSREFNFEGPPFGGNKDEYVALFKNDFEFKIFEPCYNSAPSRQGSELFIVLLRR